MSALLDHLTALLIAGVVVLLVLLTQRDASEISVGQQARYGARMQAQSFTGWFEEDLLRVGEGIRGGSGGFSLPQQRADGNTAELVAFRDTVVVRLGTRADTLRLFTRYRLVADGTGTVGGAERPLFRLERVEQARPVVHNAATPSPTAWRAGGGSPARLSFFRLDAVATGERPATTAREAAYLRARISVVPPATPRAASLPELHWGTTIGLRPF